MNLEYSPGYGDDFCLTTRYSHGIKEKPGLLQSSNSKSQTIINQFNSQDNFTNKSVKTTVR